MGETDKIPSLLRAGMTKDLRENILPFWLERAVDRERGGFYGEMLRDGTVVRDAGKGLILNARILWTFSSAYRIFKAEEYRQAADRAFGYITEHFIDREGGGGFFMVDPEGRPLNPMKMTYAQGFSLYAFSEYARATGSAEARGRAQEFFNYIEENCKAPDGRGYREFARNGAPPPPPEPRNPPPNHPPFDFSKIFSMNTHLHILEPVTCYFRIDHSPAVEESLVNLLEISLEKIYDGKNRHFNLIFDEAWTPLSQNFSYGHDIEGTWLIHEAAEVLREYAANQERAAALLDRAKTCARDMAGAVLDQGLDPATGAVYEEGDRAGKIVNHKRVWWAQAEGVVGFFNAWQLSGEERFLRAAARAWDYIDEHVIDHAGGEWFGTGTDSPDDENSNHKINPWKCPYHNSRAAFEIYERTESLL